MSQGASDAGERWTPAELAASVDGYLLMLEQQRRDVAFSKAEHIREPRSRALGRRNDKAVGQRFSNITKVFSDHGLPVVEGYPPRANVGSEVALEIWRATLLHPLAQALLSAPTDDDLELHRRSDALEDAGPLAEPPGQAQPASSSRGGRRFARDPRVQAWVRQQAAGTCELCLEGAPFLDARGRPYLEVHHVLPLGHGGSDRTSNTAALGPNCHRRCHLGGDSDAYVDRLYRQVARLRREELAGPSNDVHVVPD